MPSIHSPVAQIAALKDDRQAKQLLIPGFAYRAIGQSMPKVPPRPTRPVETPKPRGSLLGIFLALMCGIACLVGAIAFSNGVAALFLLVMLVVFGLVGFHYLVWGWWLGASLQNDELDSDGEERNY